MSYGSELQGQATVHAEYLTMLIEAGFERREAFALVRDHHALFTWVAIGPEGAPGWLGDPTSSESSPGTVHALRVSKPPTSEQ